MERKYTHFNSEKQQYYEKVNNSVNKQIGDEAEQRVCAYLNSIGIKARLSNDVEDSSKHADIILSDGTTIDVKNKNSVVIELQNFWGNPGWVFTGADYIYNIVRLGEHKNEMYVYKRQDMVDFINEHPKLFQDQYCKTFNGSSMGKAKLYFFSYKTLASMSFVKCIKL